MNIYVAGLPVSRKLEVVVLQVSQAVTHVLFATGDLSLPQDRAVTLDTSRTIGTLRFSDTSGSQTWTITNNGANSLKLDTG